ncbi:homologous recombination OB-fold protein [Eudromia elegans]
MGWTRVDGVDGQRDTQARRLQQLLGADGDLADEDFLSAVEDAENRFGSAATGSPSGRAPPPPPPREAAPLLPVVTNHLVRLVAAASRAPRAQPGGPERRRFPGPAGILPRQRHSGRHLDEILVSAPQTPAHGALAKLRPKELPGSPPAAEEDFGKGPWVAMKTELGLDERDPGCFLRTYSVVMVLRKAALKQLPKNKVPSMAVMIKTLTRSNVDAGAVFRDPTGEMQGTVHRVLLEQRPRDLRPGSVLLLKQVGVFSPSHRNHYLNVTPNNLLKIYPPEGEGGSAQAQQPAAAARPGLHRDDPTQGVSEAWGPSWSGGRGSERAPGGLSLHPESSGPGHGEPPGAAAGDVDDLDGLLGELPDDFWAPAQGDAC